MDQLTCMKTFVRVVEHGSFARASDTLNISRATATTAVAQLEKRLGVRLLMRTTRRLSLTEDGRAYYERCVRVLGDIAEMEDSLSSARASPRGRLRVSTPSSFAHLLFFPALPRFLKRHPQLSLEVIMTDRALNLVEEGIDCAVRAVEIPDDSTLVARHVASVTWLTCASPGYLADHGVPAGVPDLERHNCVRFVSPSSGRTVDWRFEKEGQPVTFTPKGNLGVNSYDAAAAAALAGIGIAQVPLPLGLHALESGKLQPLLVDWAASAPAMKLIYPGNRYLTAKVRAFADFIAEVYPSDGWSLQALARRSAPVGQKAKRGKARGSAGLAK
jgi:LysR family transcriptional regulator, regulator for bpeEF and oprC